MNNMSQGISPEFSTANRSSSNVPPFGPEDDLITVGPNIIFSNKACKTRREQWIISLITHDFTLLIIFFFMYFLSIIYAYIALDSWRFWINNFIIIAQAVLNKRIVQLASSRERKRYDLFQVSIREEKIRLFITMALQNVRFLMLTNNKVLLVPAFFMWSISINKLGVESLIWGIIPTIQVIAQFFLLGLWRSIEEYSLNGFSEQWITHVCEGLAFPCIMITFSFYMITVTEFLKNKIDALQSTREELEKALAGKLTMVKF